MEEAVRQMNDTAGQNVVVPSEPQARGVGTQVLPNSACREATCVLKIVSDHSGEELEADWAWADVLCLPTLSENFGRVVAEALERGRRVITTDGAPAWRTYFEQHPDAGIYLKGYRDGSEEKRIRMLAEALKAFVE